MVGGQDVRMGWASFMVPHFFRPKPMSLLVTPHLVSARSSEEFSLTQTNERSGKNGIWLKSGNDSWRPRQAAKQDAFCYMGWAEIKLQTSSAKIRRNTKSPHGHFWQQQAPNWIKINVLAPSATLQTRSRLNYGTLETLKALVDHHLTW